MRLYHKTVEPETVCVIHEKQSLCQPASRNNKSSEASLAFPAQYMIYQHLDIASSLHHS